MEEKLGSKNNPLFVKAAQGEQPFVDCRGLSYEDDYLASIKSALDLPSNTPEPLVGVIWWLQQRIEALEEWWENSCGYSEA